MSGPELPISRDELIDMAHVAGVVYRNTDGTVGPAWLDSVDLTPHFDLLAKLIAEKLKEIQ